MREKERKRKAAADNAVSFETSFVRRGEDGGARAIGFSDSIVLRLYLLDDD